MNVAVRSSNMLLVENSFTMPQKRYHFWLKNWESDVVIRTLLAVTFQLVAIEIMMFCLQFKMFVCERVSVIMCNKYRYKYRKIALLEMQRCILLKCLIHIRRWRRSTKKQSFVIQMVCCVFFFVCVCSVSNIRLGCVCFPT